MKSFFFLFFLFLSGCTFLMDDNEVLTLDSKSQKLSIVFSHNINGETHPCGCRHFPLGGFPSVAGVFSEIKKERPIVYVDTGDMLFPSNNIPESLYDSLSFTADNVLEGSKRIGLSLIVPGDQDLARGIDYYKNLTQNKGIPIICANFSKKAQIKSKSWTKIEHGPHKIYFIGLVFPQIFPKRHQELFTDPEAAMDLALAEIKKDGYDSKNKFHRLILLSHGGMDRDVRFVAKYKELDWVIGSHSQSFNRYPRKENNTKLVQVLSRNHHLGEIIIDLQKSKEADSYQIHEVRDEIKEKLKPNPFIKFIEDHKKQLTEIQLKEQEKLSASKGFQKHATSNSCIECHSPQGDFWQGTAHSIAYSTLINAGEKANMTCIKCHSLGAGEAKGFIKSTDIIEFEFKHAHGAEDGHTHEEMHHSEKELKELKEKYWKEVASFIPEGTVVRDLPKKVIKNKATKWAQLDEKMGVKHNFANVQCLNCHNLHAEHPFDMSGEKPTADQVKASIKERCLNCHDPDQSPEWYGKNKDKKAGALLEDVFNKHYSTMSCPRIE